MPGFVRALAYFLVAAFLLLLVAYATVFLGSERKLRQEWPVPHPTLDIPADDAAIAEGRRLATIRGCYDGCHGPKGEGAVMFDQPLIARIVAPNLTLAAKKYDAGQLAAIIRNGVRPDGHSMIVMPSQTYAGLSDADTGRIIAFLRSLPKAGEPSPPHRFGPLGRVGLAVGKFKTAAQHIADAVPAPPPTEATRAGHYLATTICAECHGSNLRGGENPSFVAPDLVVTKAYSAEAFKVLLREGRPVVPRELPTMGPASQKHFAHMTDAEIAALYDYLRVAM